MAWEFIEKHPYLSKALAGGSAFGAILTGLVKRQVHEQRADREIIDKLIRENKGKPLTAEQLKGAEYRKTKGSWQPTKYYEKATGLKGGVLKYLGSVSAPHHFKPVQTMLKYGAAGLRMANPVGMGEGVYELAKGGTKAYLDLTNTTDALEDLGRQIYEATHPSDNNGGLISQGTTDTSQPEETRETPEKGGGKTKGNGKITGGDDGKGRTTKTTKTTPYVTPYVGDPTGRTAKPDPFRFEDTKAAARGRVTAPTTTTTRGRPPRRGPHG